MLGNQIWQPIAHDKNITYKIVEVNRSGNLFKYVKCFARKISGNILYASKPLFPSFGVGLIIKLLDGKPLVLDIDDWELGFIKENIHSLSFRNRLNVLSPYVKTLLFEKLSKLTGEITVSNRFLEKKFSGTVVWSGRDTDLLDPRKFNRATIRKKYGIAEDERVVMFFGTLRIHKGIEDLVEAVNLIKNPRITLTIVGIDYHNPYNTDVSKSAKKLLNKRYKEFGMQPFQKIPEFLAMADIVAIPQKKNLATIGQIPAKVFDAMAMEKAIIATEVSDLPEILNGCGYIVEPDNPKELASAIQYILSHDSELKEIGQKARQKCVEKYSWDAIENTLQQIFQKYEKRP